MSFADEVLQNELGEALVKTTGLINPFCLEEFPYHMCPTEEEDGATVFPISELEQYRNSFPIPIPTVEVTESNIRALFSISKGPYNLERYYC